MQTLSKNIVLSIALNSVAFFSSTALASETSFSMTHTKEIASNQNVKKQRLNKTLALNSVKRTIFQGSQSKKQPSGLFLIHSVLPNNRSKAE